LKELARGQDADPEPFHAWEVLLIIGNDASAGGDSQLQYQVVLRVGQIRAPQKENGPSVRNPAHVVEDGVYVRFGKGDLAEEPFANLFVFEEQGDGKIHLELAAVDQLEQAVRGPAP
jgi:hypothetical protein